MSRAMGSNRLRAGVHAIGVAAVLVAVAAISACAEKELLVPGGGVTRVTIQVSITSADQQAGFGPRFLIAAAGFDGEGDDDGGILGYSLIPYSPGNVTLRVPVDLSKCLAYYARKGRGACPLLVGAFIVGDTSILADSSDSSLEGSSFDYFISPPVNVGASGTLPTIPPITLSASRFGVVRWEGDEALRVGGPFTPTSFNTALAGAVGPGSGVTLFAGTTGSVFSTTQNNSGSQGPYPQLAILQNGAWRRVTATTLGPGTNFGTAPFSSVTALSPTEAYAGHPAGLFKYDGTSISKVAAVTDSIVGLSSVVLPSGQKLVIGGTSNGFAWIGDGTTFTRTNVANSNQRLDAVCITGPTEAFAASLTGGGIFRYNGTTWAAAPAPAPFSGGKLALQCPAPGQAYVIAFQQAFLSWNGAGWTNLPTLGIAGGNSRLVSWGVVSPTEIYGAGDSALVDRAFYRFNGQSWQEVGRLRHQQGFGSLNSRLWADPRGGAAYFPSGFSRIEKVTPAGVSVESYQPSWRDVIVTSPTSAFAVGWNLLLARWDGVKWNFDPSPPRTPAVRIMQGVWSDGPGNAWAVGGGSTIYRYAGSGGWSVVSEISAPVATSDNYNAVWGSGSDVWAVGDATILHCRSATSCSNEQSGGSGGLFGIWGSSPNNIFAVGSGGRITRFNGTSWTPMESPTNRSLSRVHGSSSDNIWALGDSVMIRFDGTRWTNVPFTGDARFGMTRAPSSGNALFQVGLFVRSPTEVYIAGDGGIVRWNGKEWSQMTSGFSSRRVISLSMSPAGCGFAIAESNGDLPAANLYRGMGPTGCLSSPIPPVTKWP